MHGARLALIYEPDSGRPLTVVQVDDPRLITAVAEAAIAKAEERAQLLADADALLGALHREEVERLRRVLGILMSDFRAPARGLELVGDCRGADDVSDS
jgi:hypothetical protein